MIKNISTVSCLTINDTLRFNSIKKSIYATGFSWLTGDFCEDTFFCPGKIIEEHGQFVRDNYLSIDENGNNIGFGHSSEYGLITSSLVFHYLNETQINMIIERVKLETKNNAGNCFNKLSKNTLDDIICKRL